MCVVVCVFDILCVVKLCWLLLEGVLVLVKDLFDVVGEIILVGLVVLCGKFVVIVYVVVV